MGKPPGHTRPSSCIQAPTAAPGGHDCPVDWIGCSRHGAGVGVRGSIGWPAASASRCVQVRGPTRSGSYPPPPVSSQRPPARSWASAWRPRSAVHDGACRKRTAARQPPTGPAQWARRGMHYRMCRALLTSARTSIRSLISFPEVTEMVSGERAGSGPARPHFWLTEFRGSGARVLARAVAPVIFCRLIITVSFPPDGEHVPQSVQGHMLLTRLNRESWIRWVGLRTAPRTRQEVSLHRHRGRVMNQSGSSAPAAHRPDRQAARAAGLQRGCPLLRPEHGRVPGLPPGGRRGAAGPPWAGGPRRGMRDRAVLRPAPGEGGPAGRCRRH